MQTKIIIIALITCAAIIGMIVGIVYGSIPIPNKYTTQQYFDNREQMFQYIATLPIENSNITITNINDKLPAEIRGKYIAVQIDISILYNSEIKLDLPRIRGGVSTGVPIGIGTFLLAFVLFMLGAGAFMRWK